MELYSGRFDSLGDEEKTLKLFSQFIEYSKSNYTIVTREDKEKDGITPTKVHFHFLINSELKHDTLRGKMSQMGWKGALASLSNAVSPPKRTLDKSHHYVLKQQTIVFTSLSDEAIKTLLDASKKYNEEVVLKPSFNDHFITFIIPYLKEHNKVYRGDILLYIIEYVTKYNQNIKGVRMNLPTQSEMLKHLQYYEMIALPNWAPHTIIKDYKWIEDYTETAGEVVLKAQLIQKEQKEKLVLSKQPYYFEDDDSETEFTMCCMCNAEAVPIVNSGMCQPCFDTEISNCENDLEI